MAVRYGSFLSAELAQRSVNPLAFSATNGFKEDIKKAPYEKKHSNHSYPDLGSNVNEGVWSVCDIA
jgi:hypothetical protein